MFVFDEKNNLYLQQRSSEKVMFPLRWSNSVCSHPLFNNFERETHNNIGIKRAAIRRLQYEFGISHDSIGSLIFLF